MREAGDAFVKGVFSLMKTLPPAGLVHPFIHWTGNTQERCLSARPHVAPARTDLLNVPPSPGGRDWSIALLLVYLCRGFTPEARSEMWVEEGRLQRPH